MVNTTGTANAVPVTRAAAYPRESLYARRGPFDSRWSAVDRSGRQRPLPPWDCDGLFGDRSTIVPGVAGTLSWSSTCTAADDTVTWVTSFGHQSVRNEVARGAPSHPGPSFEFPVAAYLALRAGGDPLGLFDAGGSIDGDLDELLFVAGVVSHPSWMARWGLGQEAEAAFSTFFRSYPAMSATS